MASLLTLRRGSDPLDIALSDAHDLARYLPRGALSTSVEVVVERFSSFESIRYRDDGADRFTFGERSVVRFARNYLGDGFR